MDDIEQIKKRNRQVELDKAWETSWTRRVTIAVITYVIAGIWLSAIDVTSPWLNAFVPVIGYLLSTLSLSFIKRWWVSRE